MIFNEEKRHDAKTPTPPFSQLIPVDEFPATVAVHATDGDGIVCIF
jgi:hypothetical protein